MGQLSIPAALNIPEKRVSLLMETRSLDRGGIEEVIFNIANHLDRNLFHLVIVCIEGGGSVAERCRKLGIPVEVLKEDKEREYRELLSRYRIDLLITHCSTFGVKIASEIAVPVIPFLHNISCWVSDDLLSGIKDSDPMVSRYIAVSEDLKAYTVHRFNITPEKIVVIPKGIDLDIRSIVDRYGAVFHFVVALNAKAVRNKLSDQRGALQRERDFLLAEKGRLSTERDRALAEKDRFSAERSQSLDVQESVLKEMNQRLQKGEEQINELRDLVESRFQHLGKRIEYLLTRLSIKERVRERIFKLLESIHGLTPKSAREKHRSSYRELFFKKLFPDQKRFKLSSPSPLSLTVPLVREVRRFLDSVQRKGSRKLLVIYTTDPFVESRGQRSTWLAKEFARRDFPVVFFYWRWEPKEGILKSPDPRVFSVPIDEFSMIEKELFTFSSDQLQKVFLIEFPDSVLFEKINMANVHSFVTIYDCIDDWEEFAKAGQAIWYDSAVERYLVRNADLVMATNSFLAEKLKRMGSAEVPIIPNGVDPESLKQKQGVTKSLERGTLTIGYFGYLTESWFDWDLLLKTASKKGDWVFHIIGYGEPSGLELPQNIKFWGKVEHEELPSYARNWDVAIIPFKEGRLTQAVNPIKLYEYLYLGLPVVATNMQHLQEIPGVFPCSGVDFEETLILAKNTPLDRSEVERFLQSNTWGERVDRILAEIDRVDLSKDILKGIG